jgi:ABC-2 type transport system permease protein
MVADRDGATGRAPTGRRGDGATGRQGETAGPLLSPRRPIAGSPRRVLRLWVIHGYLDLLFVTRSLPQCIGYVFADFVKNGSVVVAIMLLAARFDGIGPWSRFQVVFLLGYALTVTGLLEVFFGYNVLWISRRLGRGQLDHSLIQPQPLWVGLMTEGFMPFSGSATLLPGAALMGWAAAQLSLPVTGAWLAGLATNLAGSAAVVLSFSFLWGSLAFWAPRAAEEISTSSLRLIYDLKSFPLDGLGPLFLGGLFTAVPVGFAAWLPCRALLGLERATWAGAATPLAGVAMAALMVWVFGKGLQQYGRTGSQRYRSHGFRR